MMYRLINRIHTWVTRRRVRRLTEILNEITDGETDAAINHHVGELMTLIELEATGEGRVVESVKLWCDEEEGYHLEIEYKDVEVS